VKKKEKGEGRRKPAAPFVMSFALPALPLQCRAELRRDGPLARLRGASAGALASRAGAWKGRAEERRKGERGGMGWVDVVCKKVRNSTTHISSPLLSLPFSLSFPLALAPALMRIVSCPCALRVEGGGGVFLETRRAADKASDLSLMQCPPLFLSLSFSLLLFSSPLPLCLYGFNEAPHVMQLRLFSRPSRAKETEGGAERNGRERDKLAPFAKVAPLSLSSLSFLSPLSSLLSPSRVSGAEKRDSRRSPGPPAQRRKRWQAESPRDGAVVSLPRLALSRAFLSFVFAYSLSLL